MFRRAGFQLLRNSLKLARASATVTKSSPYAADLPRGFAGLVKQSDVTVNPGFALGGARHFAKGAKGNQLARALDDEIKDQEEGYAENNAEIPHGFKVVESPGSKKLTLRKTHGNEEVELVTYVDPDMDAAYANADYEEEGDMEGEDGEERDPESQSGVPFNFMVRVTKSGENQTLVFDCSYEGDDFEIDVCHVENPDIPEADRYGGPAYHELDERLVKAFKHYLSERGVKKDAIESFFDLKNDKEEREYGKWLKDVKNFISK